MTNIVTLGVDGTFITPEKPTLPVIVGDGIGPDLWRATRPVLEAAIDRSGHAPVTWLEVPAGLKAKEERGSFLPPETLDALREHRISLKGPLNTPVGEGVRSLNVAIRRELDLYACLRPVKWIPGSPSPVRHPEKMDMIIFRENTEDVYAGLEWPAASPETNQLINFAREKLGATIRPHSAVGLKPMSEFSSKRLIRLALKWALAKKAPNLTLVHKGNIMKFTEGAFRTWGYELARDEFGNQTIPESEATAASSKLIIKDRIADNMFMQTLLRPDEYSVLAMPNLNGDYLSDALAAQIGGLGLAPGANVGDGLAIFEATHGTAPRYAGQDKANPGSLILSGALMLEFLGWGEAADLVRVAVAETIGTKIVTYDLARQMENITPVSTTTFGQAVTERIRKKN
ncbi:MAG: isocitrate dehydrogenase [Candidatus Adiutrix intracellularis]|jgi:isocitrate dehydrogenase|nr:MAG: isocitrate dehydrogenase [Candidatus Adiutrix intracellularis]MDR2826526.1 NADP-dependent isocitrate dehydrogenase [Candidatus Adiutrix intracellularis]